MNLADPVNLLDLVNLVIWVKLVDKTNLAILLMKVYMVE